MRLVYADPPYLGLCGKYGHDHRDWGCFDDLDTHAALIDHLDVFDGWAYCLQSPALAHVLPVCPLGVRVGAWVKPWSPFKIGVRPAYAWEPVLFKSARSWAELGGRQGTTTRDWLSTVPVRGPKLFGAKPQPFNRWVADLMGYREGDGLVDLFPGTGGMERERAQGVLL